MRLQLSPSVFITLPPWRRWRKHLANLLGWACVIAITVIAFMAAQYLEWDGWL